MSDNLTAFSFLASCSKHHNCGNAYNTKPDAQIQRELSPNMQAKGREHGEESRKNLVLLLIKQSLLHYMSRKLLAAGRCCWSVLLLVYCGVPRLGRCMHTRASQLPTRLLMLIHLLLLLLIHLLLVLLLWQGLLLLLLPIQELVVLLVLLLQGVLIQGGLHRWLRRRKDSVLHIRQGRGRLWYRVARVVG